MKKVFAFVAMMGLLTFGVNQTINAQEADETAMEQVAQDSAAVDSIAPAQEAAPAVEETVAPAEEKQGLHKTIKIKFIEGNAGFMSLVAIAMILGLALCIERIIFLSLSEINSKKLLEDIQAALENGDVESAKSICRETRGPVASICYQGMMRIDEGLDVVERSVVSYGSVQASNLEKNLSWITLFIAMSPSLGFLGTVIGMVQAFDDIQKAGDISPNVVAGGMKVALITTIFGIIVALVLQVFYNYILSKVEALNTDMEDSSVSLLDIIMKYNLKFKK
ncbi:MAG: MotA/TolQ/ExbB proton channel family protein [Bacteroidaceae bacterium]|nr:MotA/TolQ/ExbB proton channel family protein [Bacteroidaceae bacterium]